MPLIKGKPVDNQTRCVHYNSPLDVIAIRFKCCDTYFPCYHCHAETAGHLAQVWRVTEFTEKAVLCGVCKTELTITAYLESRNVCPACGAGFNPNCSAHYPLYFEVKA